MTVYLTIRPRDKKEKKDEFDLKFETVSDANEFITNNSGKFEPVKGWSTNLIGDLVVIPQLVVVKR